MTDFSHIRGKITMDRPLADLTWLRVGGPAQMFYQPSDVADLQAFLKALPLDTPVFPMGVGSNLIVRDGGIKGAVIRMGRGFNHIAIEGEHVRVGVAALDSHVARKAADAGLDLTFLRTIPGAIGGAVRMNAGCYGSYVADHFVEATAITRAGEDVLLNKDELEFAYRQSSLPDGWVLTEAVLRAEKGDPETLRAKMDEQLRKRDETQPTKDRTAGSTFRNPAGFSSTGKTDDTHELKAWKVIDDAGMRGATLGGAQMSTKHPNFLINTGGATAADLEGLGNMVRKKVFQTQSIELEWEVLRIGEPIPTE
jgi:UDP-N-acetylmuramate dehydrogenase